MGSVPPEEGSQFLASSFQTKAFPLGLWKKREHSWTLGQVAPFWTILGTLLDSGPGRPLLDHPGPTWELRFGVRDPVEGRDRTFVQGQPLPVPKSPQCLQDAEGLSQDRTLRSSASKCQGGPEWALGAEQLWGVRRVLEPLVCLAHFLDLPHFLRPALMMF